LGINREFNREFFLFLNCGADKSPSCIGVLGLSAKTHRGLNAQFHCDRISEPLKRFMIISSSIKTRDNTFASRLSKIALYLCTKKA
jgi:hypothetical protein